MANHKPNKRYSRSPSPNEDDAFDPKKNINPAHSHRALRAGIQKQWERHDGVQFAARHALEMHEIKEAQRIEEALITAEKKRIKELKRLELKRAQHAKYIQQREALEAKQVADIAAEAKAAEEAKLAAEAAAQAARVAQLEAERLQQEQRAALAAAAAAPPAPIAASPAVASTSNAAPSSPFTSSINGANGYAPTNMSRPGQQPNAVKMGQNIAPGMANNNAFPHSQELLAIHGRLKKLRLIVKKDCARDIEYKKVIGNARRKIVSGVGKLVPNHKDNQGPMKEMFKLIHDSLSVRDMTMVNPSDFLTPEAPGSRPNSNNQPWITDELVPSAFIYLWNIFAKSVIRQFKEEASVKVASAQHIGIVCSTLFAKYELQWRGRSMIDILIAKFRKEIPILFGVKGNEATEGGRAAINWAKMGNGQWTDSSTHNNTMTGLAAGFSAIALRNYGRSAMENPYPPPKWWNAFAAVTKVAPQHVSNTHYTILKAMIQGNEERITAFFGDKGAAAITHALYVFPRKASNFMAPEVQAVVALWEKMQKKAGMGSIETFGGAPSLQDVYPTWMKPAENSAMRPAW